MSETVNPIDVVAELAMTVNDSHIDWGMLNISEEEAYRMMAISALENKELDDPIISRAVVTALLVENMVLNVKLLQNRANDER